MLDCSVQSYAASGAALLSFKLLLEQESATRCACMHASTANLAVVHRSLASNGVA
jgi:hypothetical protein